MTTIHEVQQVMIVETPFGDSMDITLKKNHTINFNNGEK